MITLIITFLVAHIGAILGGLVGAGGIVFGLFHKKQADVVKAQAASTVAQNNSAINQGNAAASAAGEQAVVNRAKADAEAQATPREDIDAQLAAIGAQRKGE
ncbi:hypothetical protein [Caballeronia sordidicola]|uniref:Uncharacterized protein n=1 Tax=Caballeronia sordidicola TaxID=196367 RepID=A0A242N745_CABSO|nr:hypothetical protein [Caballeronia sordidicola]OTP79509.1 hypothetical protein PAMC26577_01180 [Caballeronia sordidicola]